MDNYKAAIAERWRELHETILSEEAFNTRLDTYASAFTESGAWQREYDKWNGNPVELQKDITKETAYVKDWYRRNCDNLANDIFRDIATGVDGINTPDDGNSKATFNLMGQKVDASYKGIVVTKGKKMLRK